jgi:hypothetical protein
MEPIAYFAALSLDGRYLEITLHTRDEAEAREQLEHLFPEEVVIEALLPIVFLEFSTAQ